jgi:hypothetical protein
LPATAPLLAHCKIKVLFSYSVPVIRSIWIPSYHQKAKAKKQNSRVSGTPQKSLSHKEKKEDVRHNHKNHNMLKKNTKKKKELELYLIKVFLKKI